MNLKDAKDQVEREHPELTGSAKIAAIKALREQDKREKDAAADRPGSVGQAWAVLLTVVIGMRLIALAVWGSAAGGPVWYQILYLGLLLLAVGEVVSAHRRKRKA